MRVLEMGGFVTGRSDRVRWRCKERKGTTRGVAAVTTAADQACRPAVATWLMPTCYEVDQKPAFMLRKVPL